MVSTFTANKDFEQPANNDYVDTWNIPVNADWAAIDTAFGGSTSLNATGLSGNQTLSVTQYRPLSLLISGTPTAAITYVVPSGVGGQWVVCNSTSGGKTVGVASAAGGSTIVIPAGTCTLVSCDGSATGMRLSISTSPAAAGSNGQMQYNSGGVFAGATGITTDGTSLTIASQLTVGGNTTLGSGAGNTLTVNGTAVAIPNGLNIGSNAFVITGGAIGMGTTPVGGNLLTVAGVVQSTSGGFKFPDGTLQSTAAGATSAAGPSTAVQYNNGGAFAGSSNLTFNSATGTLTALNLALTNALPVAYGGTGSTTSTGSGAVVLATSPTINGVTLTGTAVAPTQAANDNSTKIATTAYVDNALRLQSPRFQAFTSNGTFTPTVSGTYKITIVGGGGGGGSTLNSPDWVAGAGGGGAGATTVLFASLTASTPYAVVVGPGGATGPLGGGSGTAGTASSFNGVTAAGGAGGTRDGVSGAGGAGIAAASDRFGYTGGAGGYGDASTGSTGGGGGGNGGLGGSSSVGGQGAYGAGGIGGSGNNALGSGGSSGFVLVEWLAQ